LSYRRVAQWESASLTRKRPGVQYPSRLPYNSFNINKLVLKTLKNTDT
jgi:hypothetical protein